MHKRYSFFIPLVLGLVMMWWGCSQKEKQANNSPAQTVEASELSVEEHLKAIEIVTTVCESCHHPSAAPDHRLAPPLEIPKRNYLEASFSKDEFVAMLTNFIMAPSEDKAKLHSDIEEYGLMDPVGYTEEEIRMVATYIYETTLEKPDWLK